MRKVLRLDNDKKYLIESIFDKSEESMDVARESFKRGQLMTTVNRLYYASFYMLSALLLTKDLKSSKHSGIKYLFNHHFIKTKLIDIKWSKFYSLLFKERQIGDYTYFKTFKNDYVEELLKENDDFLKVIRAKIEEEF